MACLDPRVVFHMSMFLPSFRDICRTDLTCPNTTTPGSANHLLVVQVSRTMGIGTLWEYCPMSELCKTRKCAIQPNRVDVAITRPYIYTLLPQNWQARFTFIGTISSWNRSPGVPLCLRAEGRKAVVEALFYYEEDVEPLILPLLCRVHNNEIEVPLRQALTEQVIPCLNRWKRVPGELPRTFQIYNGRTRRFQDLTSIDHPIHVPLRLTCIIMFKYGHIIATPYAHMYGPGDCPLRPLCSLLAGMYDVRFIWPVNFPYPRRRLNAVSRVHGGELVHQDDPECTVEIVEG
ncbi:uncharacterized protein B0H18DRAFT_1131470 [Fomitopsis serialis]|uniref:uncharacterized protein n=1 Tax=Fomitopsis serialis TaxID=139415 RepID=UPI00200899D4|nr:uncharacterized protein B0H18DRAFT_1131470 [Neoantrodia serialis]KAH9907688.1 hypothetical protein B0H18DRAFT_1131470 [Neoantrodia serialis]